MHGADKMFELVDKVEDYPRFLPWYSKTEVIGRSGNELKARLFMDYMHVRQSFATHNRNIPGKEIRMDLLARDMAVHRFGRRYVQNRIQP